MVSAVDPRELGRSQASGWRMRTFASDRPEYRSLIVAVPIVTALVVGMAFAITPLVTIAALLALAVAIVMPQAGLAIVAFTAPLVSPPVLPPPGFEPVLVGATLLGCIYRLPVDRPTIGFSTPLAILLACLLYAGVQQSPEMLAGYAGVEAHDVGFLFFQAVAAVGLVIAAGHLLGRRSPYPVLAMAIAGSVLVAVIAIGTYAPSTAPGVLANLSAVSFDVGRATGPFSNPNYLGSFAAIMLVAAFALLVETRTWRPRIVIGASVLALAVATALSLSRGSLIAAVAGVSIIVLLRWRLVGLICLVGGVFAAVVLYPLFVQWRLENLTGSASSGAYLIMSESDEGRLIGVLAAPQLFLTSPLVGIGFGHFVPMSILVPGITTPINAHNWYLTVLAEQGLVGIVLWSALVIAIISRLRVATANAVAVGFATLGALAVASLFLEPPTTFQLIATPAIVIVAAMVGAWHVTTEPVRAALVTPRTIGAG